MKNMMGFFFKFAEAEIHDLLDRICASQVHYQILEANNTVVSGSLVEKLVMSHACRQSNMYSIYTIFVKEKKSDKQDDLPWAIMDPSYWGTLRSISRRWARTLHTIRRIHGLHDRLESIYIPSHLSTMIP